ncbi:hypothetical protein LTR84_005357 [Exophiala bonariae]|uniref:Xylanolytic transcriptional activator regulatory domain-containing protein n=1 Tax=Exophiala bonariae TaxID=1690606 RepID=A0AAV9N3L2_9EURO|nr:hypothetical protein LTR84_005357 [Exophiala bonariae]
MLVRHAEKRVKSVMAVGHVRDALGLAEATKKTVELDRLLEMFKSASDSEALELVRSLRNGVDITATPLSDGEDTTQSNWVSRDRTLDESVSPTLSAIPSVHPLFGLLQPFDLAPNRLEFRGSEKVCWTTVTQDREIIDHLLSLYFTHHHPICPVIPESLVRDDLASGKTTYCSPALLNAMLAVGCSLLGFSHELNPSGKNWPTVEAFTGEAEKLLAAHPKPNLTGIAALCLLAMLENLQLHDQRCYRFSGRASCMALFLGLHMEIVSDRYSTMVDHREATLAYVRLQLFWICFQVDQMVSMNTGWQPQIVLDETDARFATINELCDARALLPTSQTRPELHVDVMREAYMLQMVRLARIVNTTLLESKYLSFDNKKFDIENWGRRYSAWYTALPIDLSMNENASAHVMMMHMWFHGSLIQSFRPVLTRGLQETTIAHRVCEEAAHTINSLLIHYRKLYGLRGFNAILCRALLDAYTIHLHRFPVSFQNLRGIIEMFEELSMHQEWAKAWLEKLVHETRLSTAAAAGAAEALFDGKPPALPLATTAQTSLLAQIDMKAQELVGENVSQSGKNNQQQNLSPIPPRPYRRRHEYFFSPFARQ